MATFAMCARAVADDDFFAALAGFDQVVAVAASRRLWWTTRSLAAAGPCVYALVQPRGDRPPVPKSVMYEGVTIPIVFVSIESPAAPDPREQQLRLQVAASILGRRASHHEPPRRPEGVPPQTRWSTHAPLIARR